MAEIEGGYGTLIFDPNWVPTWHRNEAPARAPEEEKQSYRWWVLDSSYLPNGTFEWTGRIFQDRGEPEHITEGRIYIRCAKNNREHESVAGRVIRLIAKVAVNKFRGVEYPSMKETYRKEKGGETWIGYDAARWCRESPDRILDYNSHGKFGCLPLD